MSNVIDVILGCPVFVGQPFCLETCGVFSMKVLQISSEKKVSGAFLL